MALLGDAEEWGLSIFKLCGFARRLADCGKTTAKAVSPSSFSVKRL
jgi:hypothetical protein